MRNRSKISFLLLLGLGMTSAWPAWYDNPVNSVVGVYGNVSLNFAAVGTGQQVALFMVNSNDPAGFHLVFNFSNGGLFQTGSRHFTLSNPTVVAVSGHLGTGLTPPADPSITPLAGVATWRPTGTPSDATDTYLISVVADWSNQSAQMAGFYFENITASIVSGL
ncbi:MAG: hypothetical protein JWO30_3483 [Fibrobacteres bacterium]|nr:hypothetical protein [Fibrobacterota bacterium]